MPHSPQHSHHRRMHSWPPSTTRHLLSVAPVHFHLSPTQKKHAPAVPEPLPDIDEDPFAHFLSPMNDEDNPLDTLAFSAGIIISDAASMEKKEKLRNKLARRWAKYVAKCNVGRNGTTQHQPVERTKSGNKKLRMDAMVDEGYMSEDAEARSERMKKVKPEEEPLPYKTVLREPQPSLGESTRGRAQDLVDGGRRKKRKYRHSWRAPDGDLFTVEEEGECGDTDIEPRYHSG